MNIRQKSVNPGTTYADDEQSGFGFYTVGDFFYDITSEERLATPPKTNVSVYEASVYVFCQ